MEKLLFFGLVIVFLFLLPLNIQAEESNLTIAHDWLFNEMNRTAWNKPVDELVLSILVLDDSGYNVTPGITKLKSKQSSDYSWNRNVYDTSWGIIAYKELGISVKNETDWLLNSTSDAFSSGDWLIQVTNDEDSICQIEWVDGILQSKDITILDDKIAECNNDYWVNIRTCLGASVSGFREFDVTCAPSLDALTLLFRDNGGFHIIDEGLPLTLENSCYRRGASCDCDYSSYGSWAVKEGSKNAHTLSFLETSCAKKQGSFVSNALLFRITGDSQYADYLIDPNENLPEFGKTWGGVFSTAFVYSALSGYAPAQDELVDVKDWIVRRQLDDGSWNRNVLDTAMVLYGVLGGRAITPPIGPIGGCGDFFCNVSLNETSLNCPSDCSASRTCTFDAECDIGYDCVNNFCVIEPAGSCDFDSDCLMGYECNTQTNTCVLLVETICDDDIDDDDDGDIDCDDSDCFYNRACFGGTSEICTNNIDDDGDGAIDCLDSECSNHSSCVDQPEEEICTNNIDDDDDGDIDCEDTECSSHSSCQKGFPWIWIIIILVVLFGSIFYYFKFMKKPKKPTFEDYLDRKSQVNENKTAVNYRPRPVNTKPNRGDDKLEDELDRSIRKAREMLKRK